MPRFLELARLEEATQLLEVFTALDIESVDARTAEGRVLAQAVTATADVPNSTRSSMDGYALRAADTAGASEQNAAVLKLAGQVETGHAPTTELEAGSALRISTGGVLPAGADSVVMVEYTDTDGGTGGDSGTAARVFVRKQVQVGDCLVPTGEDMRRGDLLMQPGRRLRASDTGVLTGTGHESVRVFRLPVAGVLATGDEIVEPGTELGPGQVYNANQYSLAALLRRRGITPAVSMVVPDEAERFTKELSLAIEKCDAVFVSGGSSKGTRDLTLATIKNLGGKVLLHGLAIAPGKPTIIARVGNCAVVGVPGNPAAAVVVFALLGASLLRHLEGEPLDRIRATMPLIRARLGADVKGSSGREDWLRVRLEAGEDLPTAQPVPGRSLSLSSLARADGLARIALHRDSAAAGETVEVLLLD